MTRDARRATPGARQEPPAGHLTCLRQAPPLVKDGHSPTVARYAISADLATVRICRDAVSFPAEQNVLVPGSLRRALARVRSRCQLVLADGLYTAGATV
jgi:hypothetical protein